MDWNDAIDWTYIVGAFCVGAIVGSFLNVVRHRVPQRMSVIYPDSHCPACQRLIRATDNIPLVGWFLLGGKCRECGARISIIYPTIELLTGLAFGVIAWWWLR